MTKILLLTGAVLVFGTVNWQTIMKERLRTSENVVYLDIAKVDPRSLTQGDYMALNFALARQIQNALKPGQRGQGVAILQLDDKRVARFARMDTGGPLNAGETRFRFRSRENGVWLGTNAFFFQEDEAARYRTARFAEFHVNENGDAMLVDLRDAQLKSMPRETPK